ncbi:MAG: putative metal-binding motif-containing protein [Deltaproteobacteria bacterium]|nr:putative metal-binding motif-containing protein [Deltaproteobacteria bacterium]
MRHLITMVAVFGTAACSQPQELGFNFGDSGEAGIGDASPDTGDSSLDRDVGSDSGRPRSCRDDCDDGDPCTTDRCDDGICTNLLRDTDRDGHAPVRVGDDACRQGDDCDDFDAHSFPGAPERCDYIDNDCDGLIDEGLGYRDLPATTRMLGQEGLVQAHSIAVAPFPSPVRNAFALTWSVGLGDTNDVVFIQVMNPTGEAPPSPVAIRGYQPAARTVARWLGDECVVVGTQFHEIGPLPGPDSCFNPDCPTYMATVSPLGELLRSPEILFRDWDGTFGFPIAEGEMYVAIRPSEPGTVSLRSFDADGNPGRADAPLLDIPPGEVIGRMTAVAADAEIVWIYNTSAGDLVALSTNLDGEPVRGPRILASNAYLVGHDGATAVAANGVLHIPYRNADNSLFRVGRWSTVGDSLDEPTLIAEAAFSDHGLATDGEQLHGCFVSGALPSDLYYFRLAFDGTILQEPTLVLTDLPTRGTCFVAARGTGIVVAASDWGEFDFAGQRVVRTGTVGWTQVGCE